MRLLRDLPNRSEKRTTADPFITRDQGNSFSPGGGADKPIDRIFGIVARKLSGKDRDLSRYRLHVDARTGYKIANCVFNRVMCPNRPSGDKKSQLPNSDIRNTQSITDPGSLNRRLCTPRKAIFVGNHPHEHVRIQKNHRKISQSSSGTAGDTMSPMTSTSPRMHPNTLSGWPSAGTSFATGRPFFVITTGSRVDRTSSMTLRHRALNCPAGIVLMTTPNDYSHHIMTMSEDRSLRLIAKSGKLSATSIPAISTRPTARLHYRDFLSGRFRRCVWLLAADYPSYTSLPIRFERSFCLPWT
jgi:hypothetical protein